MIHLYYKWRYRRSQHADAFSLPRDDKRGPHSRGNFGSYLSQPCVRGRNFSSFDLPKKRQRRLRFAVMLFLVITIGWLICESATALAILGS